MELLSFEPLVVPLADALVKARWEYWAGNNVWSSDPASAVYVLAGGTLPDKDGPSRNALTPAMLAKLAPHAGPRIIYGAVCRLGEDDLRRHRLTFRQLPQALAALGG